MTLEQMQREGRNKLYIMGADGFAIDLDIEVLDQHTTNTWKAAQESAGKRYITLMNQAIGNTELPEDVWKKIAKVNQLILDNHSEPKTDSIVEMKVKEFDEVCKKMEADGITNTLNHILESGVLYKQVNLFRCMSLEAKCDGHNRAVDAIREYITKMKQ